MTVGSFISGITHYAKAKVRRYLRAQQIDYTGLRQELEKARHVLVCVVHNERPRLQYFLNYYRDLGIEHFIILDNGSSDGTSDQFRDAADISLLGAKGSYKAARYGNDWVNDVINRHCRRKWVLYADADEFLVYPHCDTQKIDRLTAYLDEAKGASMRAMMVDMYSAKPVAENQCEAGRNPLEVCEFFDRTGYEYHLDKRNSTIWIKGGVRGRVYFKDDPWNGPALNKVPLIYVDEERYFLKSTHQAWPLSINLGSMPAAVQVSGALLHFKFLSTFSEKIADHNSRAEHTNEYDVYSRGNPESFVSNITGVYKNWRDLSDLGLIQGEGWNYWKSVSAKEAAGLMPNN